MKVLWSYYLAGRILTPIIGMGRIEHYLDLLLLGDMKGVVNLLLNRKDVNPDRLDENPACM